MYARFTNLGVEGLQNEAAAQNLWRQRDEVLQMGELTIHLSILLEF